MKNRKRRNIIIILMLITALTLAAFMSAFAEGDEGTKVVTQEEYDKAQEEAKAAKEATEAKRKEAKEAAKAAAKAVANFEDAEKQLEELQSDIENKKVEISNTESLIEAKEGEIQAKEGEIEAKKAEMKAKEEEIEEQHNALSSRLTAMYKNGNAGMADVILNSEDVEDLLSNVGMVHRILESDENLLKKLQKDYKKLKELKNELEAQQAELEAQQAALKEEQAVLVDQQIALEGKEVETEELKKKYQAEADKMHQLEEQLEAEAADLAADALSKQLEAEQMIVDAGGKIDLAPGEYAWPTQSNWQISSKYGWRICPFHGKEFHNGLDIVLTSGTNGSPVYAIADGYITRASWYGGYGNCIQYACGNGISVLCGHLSGYNCKAGQYVTKGSIIGYIGSTGNSTGPHLHFTIFQNGDHINPFSLY